MFHDGSYMVGMHGFWWLFWLLMIGVWFFSGWGRSGRRRDRPRETAHEVLSRVALTLAMPRRQRA